MLSLFHRFCDQRKSADSNTEKRYASKVTVVKFTKFMLVKCCITAQSYFFPHQNQLSAWTLHHFVVLRNSARVFSTSESVRMMLRYDWKNDIWKTINAGAKGKKNAHPQLSLNRYCTLWCPHLRSAPAPSVRKPEPTEDYMPKWEWVCVLWSRGKPQSWAPRPYQLGDHGGPQGGEVLRGHAQQQHSEEQENLSMKDGHLGQTQALHQTLWTERTSLL